MNKKGFTLVELLGVVMLMSIIATIITIAIDSSIRTSRYNACLAQEKNIIDAAKVYLTDHPENNIDGAEITIETLKDGGYLEDLKNPMSNQSYSDSTFVKVKYENGYEYTLEYRNDEECSK